MSSPQRGHTTGGSGRGARRGGGAGSGSTGCQQSCSSRKQASLVPSKASKTRRLNDFPEARTSEILCKPNAGTKSPVDNRFVTGTRSALRCWLLTSGPTPFCLCEPFSCKAYPGIPGHALHEKGLQGQIGVGTLVSNQERRARAVLRINPRFCSAIGLHTIPGHALHEKGTRNKEASAHWSEASLSGSAAAVPLINQLSTAGQPRVLFLHRFT